MAVENDTPQDRNTSTQDDARIDIDPSKVMDGSEDAEVMTQADILLGDKNHLQRMMEGEAGEGEEEEEEGGDEAASLGALGTSIAIGDSSTVSADGEISFEDESLAAENEAEDGGKEQIAEKSALDSSLMGKNDQGKSGSGSIFNTRGQSEEGKGGAGSDDTEKEDGKEAAQENKEDDQEEEVEEQDSSVAGAHDGQDPALLVNQGTVGGEGAAAGVSPEAGVAGEGASAVAEGATGEGAGETGANAAEAAAAEDAAAAEAEEAKAEEKAEAKEEKAAEEDDEAKEEKAAEAAEEPVVEQPVYVEPVPQSITETFALLKQGVITFSKASGYLVSYSGGDLNKALADNILDGVVTNKLSSAQASSIIADIGEGSFISGMAGQVVSLAKSGTMSAAQAVKYADFFSGSGISLGSAQNLLDAVAQGNITSALGEQIIMKSLSANAVAIVDQFMTLESSGAIPENLMVKTLGLWVQGKVSGGMFADILQSFNEGTADAHALDLVMGLLGSNSISPAAAQAYYSIASENTLGANVPADLLQSAGTNGAVIQDITALLHNLNDPGLAASTVEIILNQISGNQLDISDAISISADVVATSLDGTAIEELLTLNANGVVEASSVVDLVHDSLTDPTSISDLIAGATDPVMSSNLTGYLLDLVASDKLTANESIVYSDTIKLFGSSTNTIEALFDALSSESIVKATVTDLLAVEVSGEPYTHAIDDLLSAMLADPQVIGETDGVALLQSIDGIAFTNVEAKAVMDAVLESGLSISDTSALFGYIDSDITPTQGAAFFTAFNNGDIDSVDITNLLDWQANDQPYPNILSSLGNIVDSSGESIETILNTLDGLVSNPNIDDVLAQDILDLYAVTWTATIEAFAGKIGGDLSVAQANQFLTAVEGGEPYANAFNEYFSLLDAPHNLAAQDVANLFELAGTDADIDAVLAEKLFDAIVSGASGFDIDVAYSLAQSVANDKIYSGETHNLLNELDGNAHFDAADLASIVNTLDTYGRVYGAIVGEITSEISNATSAAEVDNLISIFEYVHDPDVTGSAYALPGQIMDLLTNNVIGADIVAGFAQKVANTSISDDEADLFLSVLDNGEKYTGIFGDFLRMLDETDISANTGANLFNVLHSTANTPISASFAENLVTHLDGGEDGFNQDLALEIANNVNWGYITEAHAGNYLNDIGSSNPYFDVSDFQDILAAVSTFGGERYAGIMDNLQGEISGAISSADVNEVVTLFGHVNSWDISEASAQTVMGWYMNDIFPLSSDVVTMTENVITRFAGSYPDLLSYVGSAITYNGNFDATDAQELLDPAFLDEMSSESIWELTVSLAFADGDMTQAAKNIIEFVDFNAPLSGDEVSFVDGMIDAIYAADIDSSAALKLTGIAAGDYPALTIDAMYLDDYLQHIISTDNGSLSYATVLDDILVLDDGELSQADKFSFFQATFNENVSAGDAQEILSLINVGRMDGAQGLSIIANMADGDVTHIADFSLSTPGLGGVSSTTIDTSDFIIGDDAIMVFQSTIDGGDFELRLFDHEGSWVHTINLPVGADMHHVVDLSAYSGIEIEYMELFEDGVISSQTASISGMEVYSSPPPLDIPGNLSGYTLPEGMNQDEVYTLSNIETYAGDVTALIEAYDAHALNSGKLSTIEQGLVDGDLTSTGFNKILTFINDNAGNATAGIIDSSMIVSDLEGSMAGLTYSQDTGNFYIFHNTQLNYEAALSSAASETLAGASGHLVTVTSDAERNFLMNDLDTGGYNSYVWVAATDTGTEGTFVWEAGPETGSVILDEGWNTSIFTSNDDAQDWLQFSLSGGTFDAYNNNPYQYITEFEGDEVFASYYETISNSVSNLVNNVTLGNMLLEDVNQEIINQYTAEQVIDLIQDHGLNSHMAADFLSEVKKGNLDSHQVNLFMSFVGGSIAAATAISLIEKVHAGELEIGTFRFMVDYVDGNHVEVGLFDTVATFIDQNPGVNGDLISDLFNIEQVGSSDAQIEGDTLEEVINIMNDNPALTAEEVSDVIEAVHTTRLTGSDLDRLINLVQGEGNSVLSRADAAQFLEAVASGDLSPQTASELLSLAENNNFDVSEFVSFAQGSHSEVANKLVQLINTSPAINLNTAFALKDISLEAAVSPDDMAIFLDMIDRDMVDEWNIYDFTQNMVDGGSVSTLDAARIITQIVQGDLPVDTFSHVVNVYWDNSYLAENIMNNLATNQITPEAAEVYADLIVNGSQNVSGLDIVADKLMDMDVSAPASLPPAPPMDITLVRLAEEISSDWKMYDPQDLENLVDAVYDGHLHAYTAVKMLMMLKNGIYNEGDIQNLIEDATLYYPYDPNHMDNEVGYVPMSNPGTIHSWLAQPHIIGSSRANDLMQQSMEFGLLANNFEGSPGHPLNMLRLSGIDDVAKSNLLHDLVVNHTIDPVTFGNLVYMNDQMYLSDSTFEMLIQAAHIGDVSYRNAETLAEYVDHGDISQTLLGSLLDAANLSGMDSGDTMYLAHIMGENYIYSDAEFQNLLDGMDPGAPYANIIDPELAVDIFEATSVNGYIMDANAINNITDAYLNGELSRGTFHTTLNMIEDGELYSGDFETIVGFVNGAILQPAEAIMFLDEMAAGNISGEAAGYLANGLDGGILSSSGFNDFVTAVANGDMNASQASFLAQTVDNNMLGNAAMYDNMFSLISQDQLSAEDAIGLLHEVDQGHIMSSSVQSLFADISDGDLSQAAAGYVIDTIEEGYTDQGELQGLIDGLNSAISEESDAIKSALEALATTGEVEVQGSWTQTVKDIVSDFASIDDPLAAELPDPDGTLYALEVDDQNVDDIVGSVF
jgi:hypothetical protein